MKALPEASKLTATEQIPPLTEIEASAAGRSLEFGDAAQKEEASIVAGLSRKQNAEAAAASEHRRSERFRDHFECLAIFSLYVLAIAVLVLGVVWFSHMVLPVNKRWLKTEDLSHIQSIVTAGLLVGVVGNHFKKRLN